MTDPSPPSTQEESTMDQQPAPTDDDSFWGTAEGEQAPPGDEPPGAVSSPPSPHDVRHPTRKWVAATAGAAVIAVAAIVGINAGGAQTQNIGGAGASGPGGPRAGPGGGGAITGMDGSTLTVTNAGQTVKVLTSASTTFIVATAGSVADIKVADNVLVMGTAAGSTIAAEQVTDGGSVAIADGPGGPRAPPAGSSRGAPPNAGPGGNTAKAPVGGGFPGRPVAGVVKTVNGDSFTLSEPDGTTVAASTSSSTTVSVLKPSSLGALRVGDQIQATGTRGSDGTITATSVRSGILPTGPGAAGGVAAAR
jgi:hypothetical protein